MNKLFWKNKRVFITGHTGFKGSWLSLWLQSLGAQVTGYALPAKTPSLFAKAAIADGMESITGSIIDYKKLLKAITHAKPEIVFHLAAQPLVRYGYEHPVETYETNVIGTVHVLEAVRQLPSIRAVVNVTSDKCYENNEWPWAYRETDTLGGNDPYANSKACAELVTHAYRQSFFKKEHTAIATARAGNVMGGGDWAQDRLIPDIMRSLQQKNDVIIRNPGAIRPWQHVLEPLHGYLLLAEKLMKEGQTVAGSWNFGPSHTDAKPVSWITDTVLKIWGTGKWKKETKAQPHEAHYLTVDSAKARSELGWQPVLTLDEALVLTVDWYKHAQKTQDMRSFTDSQIQMYQNRLAQKVTI